MTTSLFLHRFYVFTAAVLMACSPAATAMAQDTSPPESQLQQPVSAVPAAMAVPVAQTPAANPPATATAAQKNTDAVAKDAVAKKASGADPCPAPDKAVSSAPDDLAKVQEEIDRFTLCVQRAQLLERLNESAVKSEEAYDAALGLTPPAGAVPGLPGAQQAAGLPPLPDSALAGADVTPLPASANGSNGSAGEAKPSGTDTADKGDQGNGGDTASAPEKPKDWTIREISGSGSRMQARLLSPEGDEVKVHEGMKLPDDSGVVVRIAPSGVQTRKGKSSKSLDWAKN